MSKLDEIEKREYLRRQQVRPPLRSDMVYLIARLKRLERCRLPLVEWEEWLKEVYI